MDAAAVLENLSKVKGFEGLQNKKNNRAYIATQATDENVRKSFANFSNIHVDELRKLNTVDLLTYKYVVITSPEQSIATLAAKLG